MHKLATTLRDQCMVNAYHDPRFFSYAQDLCYEDDKREKSPDPV